jgi:ElaB/YqjD/DUF883 family membrane-anchored ribosome-binding protein
VAVQFEYFRKTFMSKTNNLHRAADDAKNHVAAAIDTVKARATATADEIGRATQKTIHDAQSATEEAWSDATSRAKDLQYQIEVYLREERVNTIIMAVAAGLLLSLVLLFFRMNRK